MDIEPYEYQRLEKTMEHHANQGVSNHFNKHALSSVMHTAHWVMIAGMVVAASVATTVSTGLPITIPNMLLSTVDSAWQMMSGLEKIPEFISNISFTDWSLTHEWGSMDHSQHMDMYPDEPFFTEEGKKLLGLE